MDSTLDQSYVMTSCPYCLEKIKIGARKCPHCQTSMEITSPEGEDSVVYIVDKGLIKFSKFAGTILAIFILVGSYLFGFDIKEASEKTSQAKIEVQKALLDIEKQKVVLSKQVEEIKNKIRRIEELEKDIALHMFKTKKSAEETSRYLDELRLHKEEGLRIIVELRTLRMSEETVALAKRKEKGIKPDRGKLWNVGFNLKFYFLDGDEKYKDLVRVAISRWSEYVNLTITEVSSPEAEIRISFKQNGSWSYIGTDALGISHSEPTLNYGFLQTMGGGYAMQVLLHEFGHVLGLVHEFQNPLAGEVFNREATQEFYMGPPNNWTKGQIMNNMLSKSKVYPGSRAYDPESIMNYTFPRELFVPGKETRPNHDLSNSDKSYVTSLYPHNKQQN